MPMADFYNTLPRADESPMDYWIRLNKAIDVADECLRRRNNSSQLNSGVLLKFKSDWIVITGT
ncbi:hypothetical protein F2P79_010277 [Pimephales promelas]|nr:hypothetical protein F2P79_010277 [Pimephales promelas]